MTSILDFLKTAAPALAAVAAGPAGGLVVKALADKFGVEDEAAAVLNALHTDPDVARKLAEIDLRQFELESQDRDGARKMQIAALQQSDWFSKNFVHLLAFFIVASSLYMLNTSTEQDVRMAAVSFITFVTGYYYGTSASSKAKDKTIEGLMK